jgi:hypothetical protein
MVRKGELVNQIKDCVICEMTFASHHEQLDICNDCLKDNTKTIKEVEGWKRIRNEQQD